LGRYSKNESELKVTQDDRFIGKHEKLTIKGRCLLLRESSSGGAAEKGITQPA